MKFCCQSWGQVRLVGDIAENTGGFGDFFGQDKGVT
jgi:hypothetical protein